VRFAQQAWPGDVLTYSARVVGRREADGQRFVDLELRCVRQNGDAHLTGTATFVVPR
jgi:acyl dehydratase